MRGANKFLLLCALLQPTHAVRGPVDMSRKSCAIAGGQPSCAAWCDENNLQFHCPDCQCEACDFCKEAKQTCEPLPNSDDTRIQQCQPFCEEKDKKQHCLRCSCQACDFALIKISCRSATSLARRASAPTTVCPSTSSTTAHNAIARAVTFATTHPTRASRSTSTT